MSEAALILTEEEWETLYGVCTHYLMATAWAEPEASQLRRVPEPGKAVIERRALCKRILETR